MLTSTHIQALAAMYCHWSQVGGSPSTAWVRWTAVTKGPCVKLRVSTSSKTGVGLLPAGFRLGWPSYVRTVRQTYVWLELTGTCFVTVTMRRGGGRNRGSACLRDCVVLGQV